MNRPIEFKTILDEIVGVVSGISENDLSAAIDQITGARRIFLAGAGRSGLAARMLAMRLMQIGMTAFVAGDTTTPAIGEGDLLLVISGSGATRTMLTLTDKATAAKAKILLLTYSPDSELGKIAGTVLPLPVPADPQKAGGLGGRQLLGTLFEQAVILTSDLLATRLASNLGVSGAVMQQRHANLE